MKTIYRVVLLFIIFSQNGISASYVAEKGSGEPVCDAFIHLISKNAQNTSSNSIPSSTNVSNEHIRWADWRGPDGLSISVDKIIDYIWKRDVNPAWYVIDLTTWRGTTAQIRSAKRSFVRQIGSDEDGMVPSVTLQFTTFDFDNDGQAELMGAFKNGPFGPLLLVLSPDGASVDAQKTERLLQHPRWGDKGSGNIRQEKDTTDQSTPRSSHIARVDDALHGASYGIFNYEGTSYISLWWLQDPLNARRTKPTLPESWRFRIFKITKGQTKELCVLRMSY